MYQILKHKKIQVQRGAEGEVLSRIRPQSRRASRVPSAARHPAPECHPGAFRMCAFMPILIRFRLPQLQCFGGFRGPRGSLFLVLEFCGRGDLHDRLEATLSAQKSRGGILSLVLLRIGCKGTGWIAARERGKEGRRGKMSVLPLWLCVQVWRIFLQVSRRSVLYHDPSASITTRLTLTAVFLRSSRDCDVCTTRAWCTGT